jgi:putative PIN family toxin of toxin-antitoxin system
MQKIILDTNVIVSSLITNSYPHYIVYEQVLDGHVQLCLSNALFDEYRDVLARSKFSKIPHFKSNSDVLLNRFMEIAIFFVPKIYLDIIKDRDDNKLLELADESEADFLITGNHADFIMTHYKNTRILSPRNFWEICRYGGEIN